MKTYLKKYLLLFVLSFSFCTLYSCSNNNSSKTSTEVRMETSEQTSAEASAEASAEVNVNLNSTKSDYKIIVDHEGREVKIPTEIKRIAVVESASPLPSILCLYFNSSDKIVGMPKPCLSAAKASVLSKLYPNILKVNTSYMDGAALNIEELIKLEPDLVFYTAGNKAYKEAIENAGLNGVAISVSKWDYNVLETFKNWIKFLDDIFGGHEISEYLINYADSKYNFVQDRVKNLKDEEKEKLFILFQLTENNILTSGKKFWGEFWANAIGAKNVATDIPGERAVNINMEQLYSFNPSLMFITNFTPVMAEDVCENLVGDFDFSELDAVKNKKVYKMPLGMYRSYTPGIDTPITLLTLAKYAYPKIFEDVNIEEEARNYYKNAFNVDLTNEDIEKIFMPDKKAGENNNK